MLMEVGPVKSEPMGDTVAIGWGELAPYVALTVGEVEHWEAVTIIQMSNAYANGLSEGKNPFSLAPIDREQDETAP